MNGNRSIRQSLCRGLVALTLPAVIAACATRQERDVKPLDKVLVGVPDPQMRERWRRADAEGRLPSVEAIPTPKQRVTQRRPVELKEPARSPNRPVIPPQTVATAQPFSSKPLAEYDGEFRVVDHKAGVLIGSLEKRDEPLELHYKLPGDGRQIAVAERSTLALSLRDEVLDSTLQRRIVLRTTQGTTPFVFIAEGSNRPYREAIQDVRLTIEQLGAESPRKDGVEHPPVKVTYGNDTVTLQQGERRTLGSGDRSVEVYLLESLAASQQLTMLREGQPYYVSLILYQAR